MIDRNWDLKKFVTFVRETYRISWKEIYWKVWSYLYLIRCDRCQDYYPVAEMGNCRYHPEPPKAKAAGSSAGTYEYKCCNEVVEIYDVLNGKKGEHGCQTQLHGTSYIYALPKHKEQKIIDRTIAHQLIILENPSGQIIERLEFTHSEENTETQAEGTGVQPTIVRPSSLNYKISLLEATNTFISKDK